MLASSSLLQAQSFRTTAPICIASLVPASPGCRQLSAESCRPAGAQLSPGQFQLPHLTPEMAKLAQNGTLGALFQGQSPHLMGLPTGAYPTAPSALARGLTAMQAPPHMAHLKPDPGNAELHRQIKPEGGKDRQPSVPLKAEQADQQVALRLAVMSIVACTLHHSQEKSVKLCCTARQPTTSCQQNVACGAEPLCWMIEQVPTCGMPVQGESERGFVQATPHAPVGRPAAGRREDMSARMDHAGAGDAYAALSQMRHLPHAPGESRAVLRLNLLVRCGMV